MANVRSDTMAIQLAVPSARQSARLNHGRMRLRRFIITFAAADANATLYVADRFRASDTILRVLFMNTAMAAVTSVDCGWYTAVDWTAADGAVKAATAYNTAMSFAAAVTTWTDLTSKATANLVAGTAGRQVWQDAGDATEPAPGTQYDLTLRGNVVTGGAGGTLVGQVYYTTGD